MILSLSLSLISLCLLVLLLKSNEYFLNLLFKFRQFWFYDYTNIILVVCIVPGLNIFALTLVTVYSIYRFIKELK